MFESEPAGDSLLRGEGCDERLTCHGIDEKGTAPRAFVDHQHHLHVNALAQLHVCESEACLCGCTDLGIHT